MEDTNEYWKFMDYPPIFTNIDWNDNQSTTTAETFIPMEYEQKMPHKLEPPPFQRRRSSSVDLPINPLYMKFNNNESIPEEIPMKIGSSSTLEFPANYDFNFNFDFNNNNNNNGMLVSSSDELSSCSSSNNSPQQQQQQQTSPIINNNKQTKPQETFFPDLDRTSYNFLLGQQLRQHQKRRRSSSLPPVFHTKQQQQREKKPTPLIFTQIQVADPTPVQHVQKAPKTDQKPIPIERVVKKPQIRKPVDCDPAEKQRKLDQELINLNFDDVTVAELKEMLKERGLSNTGKKAVLTERLKQIRDRVRKKSNDSNTSPAIQGMANMTIDSPQQPIPLENFNGNMMNTDFSDLLNFEPMVDEGDNSSLFPESVDPLSPVTVQRWESEWDQDKLDDFLTELV